MTKDKFETLCEQILVPRIGSLLHRELTEMHSGLELISVELIRIRKAIEGRADRR